ncbi:MAG: hypothetical protein QNK68_05425 [Flavobacteriales bacterium]
MVTESKRIIDLTSIELADAITLQFKEELQKSEERVLEVIKSNLQASEIGSKLLSIQETADLFNFTRANIHDLMNKGIIKQSNKR